MMAINIKRLRIITNFTQLFLKYHHLVINHYKNTMKKLLIVICLTNLVSAYTQELNDSSQSINLTITSIHKVDIKGFYSSLDIGYLFGPGEIDPAGISVSLAFQLDNDYSLAASTGIEFFHDPVMPVLGEIRYTFEDMRIAPIAYFQAGYAFPLKQPNNLYYWDDPTEAKGGLLINPGIGVLLPMNKSTLFHIGIGFRYQELNFHKHNDWLNEVVYRTDIYKRINFRVGLCFN